MQWAAVCLASQLLNRTRAAPGQTRLRSPSLCNGRLTPVRHVCRAAFALLFGVSIAYNRLEFTISKDEKWQATHASERLANVMQQISAVLEGAHWHLAAW